jgi:hypothetical protein
MNANANADDAIVSRLAEKAQQQEDAEKIKRAFRCLTDPAVKMLLRGLRAEGIKSVDEWLNQQALPQTGSRQAVEHRLIADGSGPKDIGWKPFCNLVRDKCDGWVTIRGKRKPKWGFGERQIRRDVMGVKDI